MIYSKPDYSVGVWANNGNFSQPTSEKIETGFVIEKPFNEIVNYIENKQDIGLAYLFQKGISEWDSVTTYPVNGIADYNGTTYRALKQNSATAPTNTSQWRVAYADYNDYVALKKDLDDTKNVVDHAPKIVYKDKPVFNKKAHGKGFVAAAGTNPNGSNDVGYAFSTNLSTGFFLNGSDITAYKNGSVQAILSTPPNLESKTKHVVTLDILNDLVNAKIADIEDRLRIKVGALYLTTDPNNPRTILGYGQWNPHAQGRALVGVSSSSSHPQWTRYGSSEFGSYTHSLTEAENGKHTHSVSTYSEYSYAGDSGRFGGQAIVPYVGNTSSSGSGTPHNIVQPSVTVYVWRRTS